MKSIHPDLRSLILYGDGEMPPARRRRVEAHLRQCPQCRLKHHRLKSRLAAAATQEAPDEDTQAGAAFLDRTMSAIRGWEAARSAASGVHSVKRRAAGKLGSFLGVRATDRILESVSDNGDNLLSAIEPVLAMFLGRRAAADMAGDIAKEAIVRLW